MESDPFLIGQSLQLPTAAISYQVGRRLAELFPERAIYEADGTAFDLVGFAATRSCSLQANPLVHCQIETEFCGPSEGITQKARNAWYEVKWEDHTFDVLLMTWAAAFCERTTCWILADTQRIADRFFETVCEWSSEIRHEVLVFDGGAWQKSADLFESIQGSTFANLILPAELKQEIQTDAAQFFASEDVYRRYGVAWKRGILLVGPPGNGKTHAVKAVINASQKPCLYVKSFKSHFSTDHDNIRTVFRRARQNPPCILVLEDLDSLVDDGNRAFFLNEVDGFAENSGILTVATTNHPGRLDPAIIDRPSRFDRKYHFDLPAAAERTAYVSRWNQSQPTELKLTNEGVQRVVDASHTFSFAYLKELFLSASMKWVSEAGARSMDHVALEQLTRLRSQMRSTVIPWTPTNRWTRLMSAVRRRFGESD